MKWFVKCFWIINFTFLLIRFMIIVPWTSWIFFKHSIFHEFVELSYLWVFDLFMPDGSNVLMFFHSRLVSIWDISGWIKFGICVVSRIIAQLCCPWNFQELQRKLCPEGIAQNVQTAFNFTSFALRFSSSGLPFLWLYFYYLHLPLCSFRSGKWLGAGEKKKNLFHFSPFSVFLLTFSS